MVVKNEFYRGIIGKWLDGEGIDFERDLIRKNEIGGLCRYAIR
jgi:hypothetical protein